MATQIAVPHNNRYKAGWIVLLVVSGLMTLNHFLLIFLENEPTLFIGWTAFTLYATLVVWIPFRRGEVWSWYSSWIVVITFASAIFFNAQVGRFYLGAAVIIGIGLLLTYSAFFQDNGKA